MLLIYYRSKKKELKKNCRLNIDLDKKTKYDQPMFFDKTWEFYDDLIDVGIILYIPKGQNLDNCEEMISIQRIDAQGQGSKKLYKNLHFQMIFLNSEFLLHCLS